MGRIKNLLRNLNYLSKHSLWDDNEAQIVYLTNKILSDASYEFDLDYENKKRLKILSTGETLALLEKEDKSFIRTGDGEIRLMMGIDHPFQRYNNDVAERLINALEKPKENLLVGLKRHYFTPLMPYGNPFFYRRNAFEFREFYLQHCSEDVQYFDANCTGILGAKDCHLDLREHYNRWRKLFQGRDIVIVCGRGILDTFEYDIFELAASKRYIYGPRVNAWDEHLSIINTIKQDVSRNQMLVFILGQAGKAMITELVDLGYTCWDVGHLAKYYNAVMTNMEWNDENRAKFYAPD